MRSQAPTKPAARTTAAPPRARRNRLASAGQVEVCQQPSTPSSMSSPSSESRAAGAGLAYSRRAVRAIVCAIGIAALIAGLSLGIVEQAAQPEPKPQQRPERDAGARPLLRRSLPAEPRTCSPGSRIHQPEKLPPLHAVKQPSLRPDLTPPAGLAVAPDGRILYSELWGGKIRVLLLRERCRRPRAVGRRQPALRHPLDGALHHGGLLGHPGVRPRVRQESLCLRRLQVPASRPACRRRRWFSGYKDVSGRGVAPRIILTIRAKIFDNAYSVVFGPNRMLYVPSGFLGRSRPKGERPARRPAGQDPPRHPRRSFARQQSAWRKGTAGVGERLQERLRPRVLPGIGSRRAGESGPKPTTRSIS